MDMEINHATGAQCRLHVMDRQGGVGKMLKDRAAGDNVAGAFLRRTLEYVSLNDDRLRYPPGNP